MNLQQLEYIVAIDNYRHFLKAANACNITQATLSMMVKKLEEELNAIIFDRSKQPVVPTLVGEKIIAQARRVLNEGKQLKEIVLSGHGQISGDLKVGIIPTIAPYLLPLVLKNISKKYPKLNLFIYEFTTNIIIEKLKSGEIDVGILATPLAEKTIVEMPLYYEQYFLYINKNETQFDKKYVLPQHITLDKLWLLEEGHCMRSQIFNFCELKKEQHFQSQFTYEAGSIETLMNLVDSNYGVTIIPELACSKISAKQKMQLRYFKSPTPVREVSLVTHHQYVKEKLIKALKEIILNSVPEEMKTKANQNIIAI
ncbi:MAG: hydrogen peroxide-inducible genes activator [Bacteroidota bacterium]